MKRSVRIGFVVVVLLVICDSVNNHAYTLSSGAPFGPTGYTGSPADRGETCSISGCHYDAPVIGIEGWITSNAGPEGYFPDSVYIITVTAIDSFSDRFGFMASVQDRSGDFQGKLFSIGNESIQIKGSNNYVTHTLEGTSGIGTKSWSFNWIAPRQGAGSAIVYVAVNAANRNGKPTGDIIYTSSLEIPEAKIKKEFELYPNPFSRVVRFKSQMESEEPVSISIFNSLGKEIYQSEQLLGENVEYQIHLPNLTTGIYILRIENNFELIQKKLLKIK